MAAPIRPSLPHVPTPSQTGAPNNAARAAQRAFFSQALNAAQAGDPVAPAAPVEPVQRRAAAERVDIPGEQPAPSTRPGSYLDIKV